MELDLIIKLLFKRLISLFLLLLILPSNSSNAQKIIRHKVKLNKINQEKSNDTKNINSSKRKDYALLFYISGYNGSNLPNLDGTKRNAKQLSRVLST